VPVVDQSSTPIEAYRFLQPDISTPGREVMNTTNDGRYTCTAEEQDQLDQFIVASIALWSDTKESRNP